MIDLTNLCNDKFRLLEYMELFEEYSDNGPVVKLSQDEMAIALSLSRHTIKSMIDDLKSFGYLQDTYNKGKYVITTEGHNAIDILCDGKRKIKASKYKCASFFAGVGGIDLGFEKNGFSTIYANEFDPKAIHTYENNFSLKVDNRDIHEIVEQIENGSDPFINKIFSIVLAGFPCQAFSVAGYREGFEDKKGRGGLFFELMKIIRFSKPEIVFLENVKNLVGHDNGKTFKIIIEALESENYFIKYSVLNSMDYGNLPQNRERIYIVAFKDKNKCEKFRFPFPVNLTNKLNNLINFKKVVNEKYYYTEKFPHYDELVKNMKSQETAYQWRRVYVRENKNNVCPTLTANMGTGGHNVPLILTDHGIRKLTPEECFALQGFPSSYKLPDNIATSYLYKQAGNSVSVSVIERIAKEILKVI